MELSVVPVFQSEIAPTQIRGFIVGTYHLTIVVSSRNGQFLTHNEHCLQAHLVWWNGNWLGLQWNKQDGR